MVIVVNDLMVLSGNLEKWKWNLESESRWI